MENKIKINLLNIFNEFFLSEAYRLLQDNLGATYITFSKFCDYVKNDQVFVQVNNDEIVGVLIFEIISENDFFTEYSINETSKNVKILNLKTLSTKYKRKGIGTQLVKYCIEKYENSVSKIYSPLWKSKQGTNAEKLFQNLNFKYLIEIDNFWYQDSLSKENYCPICGNPCFCSMVIYYKNVI